MQVLHNELIKYKGHVPITDDVGIDSFVWDLVRNKKKVYSYSLYAEEGPEGKSYRLEVLYSMIERYNTINISTIVERVSLAIAKDNEPSSKLIGYKQPPLEILIRAYEPLIINLAKRQHEHWREIEIEDLQQMCRLVICILYNSGYYIHKKLIVKTFNNYVLQYLKHERYRPTIVSLDEPIKAKGENLTVKDVIKDDDYEQKIQDEEDYEENLTFLNEFRSLVIQEIGERSYEQLLKQYSNKSTDAWGQKTVYRLKGKFHKRGSLKRIKQRYDI